MLRRDPFKTGSPEAIRDAVKNNKKVTEMLGRDYRKPFVVPKKM